MKVVEVDGFYVEISEGSPPTVAGPAPEDGGEGLQLERTGASGEAVAAKVKDLRGTIAEVCRTVRDAFVEANAPDELSVTFGIKLGGELGVPFVSRGTGEASIVVAATWKKDRGE
ncbi:MAG: hypothetical protein KC501_16610 [Myxococcales bacterium]|nr:hypothetical protein [Myxococcales bacterium]